MELDWVAWNGWDGFNIYGVESWFNWFRSTQGVYVQIVGTAHNAPYIHIIARHIICDTHLKINNITIDCSRTIPVFESN